MMTMSEFDRNGDITWMPRRLRDFFMNMLRRLCEIYPGVEYDAKKKIVTFLLHEAVKRFVFSIQNTDDEERLRLLLRADFNIMRKLEIADIDSIDEDAMTVTHGYVHMVSKETVMMLETSKGFMSEDIERPFETELLKIKELRSEMQTIDHLHKLSEMDVEQKRLHEFYYAGLGVPAKRARFEYWTEAGFHNLKTNVIEPHEAAVPQTPLSTIESGAAGSAM